VVVEHIRAIIIGIRGSLNAKYRLKIERVCDWPRLPSIDPILRIGRGVLSIRTSTHTEAFLGVFFLAAGKEPRALTRFVAAINTDPSGVACRVGALREQRLDPERHYREPT